MNTGPADIYVGMALRVLALCGHLCRELALFGHLCRSLSSDTFFHVFLLFFVLELNARNIIIISDISQQIFQQYSVRSICALRHHINNANPLEMAKSPTGTKFVAYRSQKV
jgi:hypothetical protein